MPFSVPPLSVFVELPRQQIKAVSPVWSCHSLPPFSSCLLHKHSCSPSFEDFCSQLVHTLLSKNLIQFVRKLLPVNDLIVQFCPSFISLSVTFLDSFSVFSVCIFLTEIFCYLDFCAWHTCRYLFKTSFLAQGSSHLIPINVNGNCMAKLITMYCAEHLAFSIFPLFSL